MTDLTELTQRVCDHLAGRHVVLKWRDPPSSSAVGQVVKTSDGQFIVYVSPTLTGVNTRLQVMLHELSHVRNDADFVPVSNDHRQPSRSIARSKTDRSEWRKHPREERAQKIGDEWFKYAERNAGRYFTGPQTNMECMLLALLNWSE